jgi:hypothetical protein
VVVRKVDKTKLQKILKKEMTRKDFLSLTALSIISAVGIGGVLAEIASHAEGPYSSVYPELGTLAGGAAVTPNTSALDSEDIQFGSSSTGTLAPHAPATIAGVTVPTTLVFHDEFSSSTLDTTKWLPGYYYDGVNGGGAFGSSNTLKETNVALGANGLELTLSGSESAGIVGCVCSLPWANGGPWTPNATLGITNPITDFKGFSIGPSGGGVGGSNPGAAGPVYIEWQATDPSGGGGLANWFALWLITNLSDDPNNSVLEIDVLESGGVANSTVHYVNYGTSDPADYQRQSISPGTSPATGGVAHTWGVLYTTEFVAFVLDGVVQQGNNGQPFYFSAAGEGALNTPPVALVMCNTYGGLAPVFPSTAYVRYARVFQD